jgi:hypothetical protein
MVNTKTMGHVFRHPDYYKKLRASLKKEAISPDSATAESGRALEATSDKPQASSVKQQAIDETVPHCDIEEAATINRINKKEENE